MTLSVLNSVWRCPLNSSNFLLQKLNSYGESYNFRGTMAPLLPPPMSFSKSWFQLEMKVTVSVSYILFVKWHALLQ